MLIGEYRRTDGDAVLDAPFQVIPDALCQGISLDQIVFQLVLTDDSANPTPTPEQTPVQPTPTSEATPAPAPTPTNETVTPDNNSESDGNERSAGRKISPASFRLIWIIRWSII